MNTIYTCIGYRSVSFKGSDGNQVEGTNFFFTYEDSYITGLGVEKVFIPASRLHYMSFVPDVGATCELFYNKYGKVADIGKV